jgi:hypothetical protein
VKILERLPANTNFANQNYNVQELRPKHLAQEQKEFDNQKPFVSRE